MPCLGTCSTPIPEEAALGRAGLAGTGGGRSNPCPFGGEGTAVPILLGAFGNSLNLGADAAELRIISEYVLGGVVGAGTGGTSTGSPPVYETSGTVPETASATLGPPEPLGWSVASSTPATLGPPEPTSPGGLASAILGPPELAPPDELACSPATLGPPAAPPLPITTSSSESASTNTPCRGTSSSDSEDGGCVVSVSGRGCGIDASDVVLAGAEAGAKS